MLLDIEIFFALLAMLVIGFSLVFLLVLKFALPATVQKNYKYVPSVSVVIPTMNEERIIEKRITNILEMDYPREKLEVLFIDNSKDKTAKIIEGYSQKYPFLKLLKQEKSGFNNALNQGYSTASGELVIKSDCTAFPYPNAIHEAVANFADGSIGAVTGIHVFNGSNESLEKEFKGLMYKVQLMESYLHSSLISHGSFGVYRRILIPTLGQEITADDSEVVVNVVRNGYRAIVDSAVRSEEEVPIGFRERRSQKNRRAAGVIRVLLRNLDMLFNKKYGRFGVVTMPVDLFLIVLSPLAFFAVCILWVLYLLTNPSVTMFLLSMAVGFLATISIAISAKVRAIADTYLSCFVGFFQSFSRKKTWK